MAIIPKLVRWEGRVDFIDSFPFIGMFSLRIECLLLISIIPHILIISVIINSYYHLVNETSNTRFLLSSDLSIFLELEESIYSSFPHIRRPREFLPRRLPHCTCDIKDDQSNTISSICPSGPPGRNGKPGTDGSPGLKGKDGEKGTDGLLPSYFTVIVRGCRVCPYGKKGADGPPGPEGPQGRPGEIGPRGVNGIPGMRGKIGEEGAKGEDGADGIEGACGEPGDEGTNGIKGPSGQIGPTGISGEKGDAGVDGEAGKGGKDGAEGEMGRMGIMGRNGTRGPPGETGPRGTMNQDRRYCSCPSRIRERKHL